MMRLGRTLRWWGGLAAMAVAAAHAAGPLVGMTLPLSGPDAAAGQAYRQGAQLAVARANASGQPMELMVLDDGGDPQRAVANVRHLLRAGAVALTGPYGASATAAVSTVLASEGPDPPLAPLVAPFTSADVLRAPARAGVFHWRAGTAEQASAALLHLDTLGVTQVAVLAQADALGDSGLERVIFELTRIALRPAAVERVPAVAAPADLQSAMTRICAMRPEAIVIAGDATVALAALQAATVQRCGTYRVVFSEAGATIAARPSGSTGPHPQAGLLVTQVVPHPQRTLHPLAAEYQRELLAQRNAAASHASFEGYLVLRVVQEALRVCPRQPMRQCLLKTLGSRNFDLPGLPVRFGREQRQQRPLVEITMLDEEGKLRH